MVVFTFGWRLGTGFSDEMLIQLTESSKELQIEEKPKKYAVSKALKPDVWFQPNQVIFWQKETKILKVWEIECDMLSLSPMYFVGKSTIDPEKGLSLRFPRFLKVRTDKTVEESTCTQEVISLIHID